MTTRTSSKEALKENSKHVLEELWDAEEEEQLYKIFKRECLGAKIIQKMLCCSKEGLQDLSCREDEDFVLCLQKHKVGHIRIMVRYQSHLRAKDILPGGMETFRFNYIFRKDCNSFVNHPDDITLFSSTCDMTTTPPSNFGLVDSFKVAYSPFDPFKCLLKYVQVFLLLLSQGHIRVLGTGIPSPLLERMS